MVETDGIKHELVEQYKKRDPKKKSIIDDHEVKIIVAALSALTAGLLFGRLSEPSYTSLMGAFLGYTFGRIFNGWQGKE